MRTFIKQLLPCISISFIMSFMLAMFEPLVLYFTNIEEFSYSFYILFPIQVFGFVILFFINTSIYIIISLIENTLKKKDIIKKHWRITDWVLLFESICFVAMYIQGNYIAGNLPSMDGSVVNWSDYGKDTVISIILWVIVVVVIGCLAYVFKFERLRKCITLISVCAFLMFMITITTVCITNDGLREKNSGVMTSNGLLDVSSDTNMIIFLVDATNSKESVQVLREDERFKDTFDGFTYYSDTMGVYPFTSYSIPYILGGQLAVNNRSFTEYATKNLTESKLFEKLKQKGYSIGLYTQEIPWEDNSAYECENIVDSERAISDKFIFLKKQIKFSLYKYMPYGIKQFFEDNMGVIEQLMKTSDNEHIYSYYNNAAGIKIKNSSINVVDEKKFRFIHVEGSHTPFCFDEEFNALPKDIYTDYYTAVRGSIYLVNNYIEKLKKAGVYDNSIIIVMSDHGYNADESASDRTFGRENPFFMVKGLNEHHKLTYDEAPISYEDLQEAYDRLLDGKKSNEVFDWSEGDRRARRYYFYYYDGDDLIREFIQMKKASDTEDLQETGKKIIK